MSSLLSLMASFCTDKTRTRWKGSDQMIRDFLYEMNSPREQAARRVGKGTLSAVTDNLPELRKNKN